MNEEFKEICEGLYVHFRNSYNKRVVEDGLKESFDDFVDRTKNNILKGIEMFPKQYPEPEWFKDRLLRSNQYMKDRYKDDLGTQGHGGDQNGIQTE